MKSFKKVKSEVEESKLQNSRTIREWKCILKHTYPIIVAAASVPITTYDKWD